MAIGQGWVRGALLRVTGAVALAAAWLLMRWLFGSLDLGPRHTPGTLELAAAALGFLCFSMGTALVLVGGHLFDQVEVSRRWAKRQP